MIFAQPDEAAGQDLPSTAVASIRSTRRRRLHRCRVHAARNGDAVHRYYDPATGQFLSVDPANAITNQPYAYATSDPANNTDSSGLDPFDDPTEGPGLAPPAGVPATSGADWYELAGWTQDSEGIWVPPSVVAAANNEATDLACQGATSFTGYDYVNLASEERTQHILYGEPGSGGHLWPGQPGKTAFPPSWSEGQILHAASDIATDPTAWAYAEPQGSRTVLMGTYDGVDITVIVQTSNGAIVTAFPTNLPRNP
jgi:filamentous hemagglutinin